MPEKKIIKKSAKKTAPKTPARKKPVAKKSVAIPAVKETPEKKLPLRSGDYIQTVGRRKRSIAQVRIFKNGKGDILINDKDYKIYFPVLSLQNTILAPLNAIGENGYDVTVKVAGGGIRGQAEAVRLGISRALILIDPKLKPSLKKPGYLTRDPRKKERKKPGLKKARRAPQWSKR